MARFGLLDCNNFYASCERLFRPELRDRPVVVLSNNDGCVIARSAEAKALGVPMGAPAFQWERFFERRGVAVFSCNFPLYGDLSARVMETLAAMVPSLEVYSIDEAFFDLSGVAEAEALCRAVRARVLRDTGVPVSIGLAPTRTLAKLANHRAKRDPAAGGVFDWAACADPEGFLRATDVSEVWGVGGRIARRLAACGARTALDFARMPGEWVRREFTIVGRQTQLELLGRSCLPFFAAPAVRRSVLCSRSFAELLESRDYLREAVCSFAARAAEKLRRARCCAGAVQVFIETPRHRENLPQRRGQATSAFAAPTDFSPEIVRTALRCLDAAYREGFAYQRAGVLLLDLAPADGRQASFFDPPAEERERKRRLSAACDAIRARYGRASLRFALEAGRDRPWRMRQLRRSPRYTTSWDDLPRVGEGRLPPAPPRSASGASG